MTSAHTPPPAPRALPSGAQQLLQVQAGWVLHVQRGSLLLRLPLALEPALSLSDTVWQARQQLTAGAVWVAQAPGWIRLDSRDPSCLYTLRQVNPAPARWRLLAVHLLQRLIQRLIQRLQPRPTSQLSRSAD
ncbi:hypothetical protein [Paucibacter sp. KCTC 42545]|uniref:hypothetical protein n=1 Tax=Paucibacter sp. KCTC 42545 TaxID=1768242 RepID=UPI0012E3D77F|nr:hypothetical protein [Paucibacter sp. KCTC 42545]